MINLVAWLVRPTVSSHRNAHIESHRLAPGNALHPAAVLTNHRLEDRLFDVMWRAE